MDKICIHCGSKVGPDSIEITVKIRGLIYCTFVSGQTCQACRGRKVDPSALAAFKIGVAMRAIDSGRLTGRRHAYCRKALRLGVEDLARQLNLSVECLLALEDTDTPVPDKMFGHMARQVRRYFRSMSFVPRIPLDEEDFRSLRSLQA